MSFSVQGIVMPEMMTGSVAARQLTAVSGGQETTEESTTNYCLNYPHKASAAYPYFGVKMFVKQNFEFELSDFDVHNAAIDVSGYDEANGFVYLYVHPIEADEPCYVQFEEFVFFVGNYGD